MFVEGYRALDERFGDFDGVEGEPREVLANAITRFLEFCAESLPRYQIMFTRVVPGWEPSPEAYAVSLASYDRLAAHLSRLGITAARALDLWTALTTGLVSQQLANDPGGDRWFRLADDAAAMFLDHVRRPS